MSFWSKRIKNEKDIAKALNVSEDKIKALKNNELTIGGNTMDRTLEAIEEERINKAIRENDIWKWILKTDFKKKRGEFGYDTQREVAKLVGCDVSIICNLENHKERFKKVSPKLISIYEFYTNDFNKKIKSDKNTKTLLKAKTTKQVNKDKREIWKWYKKTNIRELRKNSGIASVYDMAHKLGISESCVSDLELKRFKRVNKSITNAYNYFNYKDQPQEDVSKDVIFDWYKSIEDIPTYRRAFGYSLNKFMSELNLSYDQARTFERHEYKNATPVVEKIYNFYHDESKRLKAIEWEPVENNTFVKNTTPTIITLPSDNDTIKELQYQINYLTKLNEKYEKIIDKLIERL